MDQKIGDILNAMHTQKAALGGGLPVSDQFGWCPVWTIEKYHGEVKPENLYAVETIKGNLMLNAGITEDLKLLIGAAATPFNNANARLGVGDSSAAVVATQTGLQAAVNKAYLPMDATYPQVSGQVVTFKGTAGAAVANYAWNEFTVDNGTTTLNRKQESHGTKANGDSWVLTLTVTKS